MNDASKVDYLKEKNMGVKAKVSGAKSFKAAQFPASIYNSNSWLCGA
jgi:hypothetical protein